MIPPSLGLAIWQAASLQLEAQTDAPTGSRLSEPRTGNKCMREPGGLIVPKKMDHKLE